MPKGAEVDIQFGVGRRARRKTSKFRWRRLLFLAPALIYVIVIFVFPIVYNLLMSFQNYTIQSMVNGDAPFVGFANYIAVLTNSLMGHTIWNTLVFTIASVAIQFGAGLLLAIFFKRRFPLNQLLRTMLLIPWLLPLIVSATAFRWMFDQTNGIINQLLLDLHIIPHPIGWLLSPGMGLTALIITNIWVGIPFNLVLLYSGLQDIPEDYYEAGALDGANGWKAFWHITLPSLRPVIAIVLMLGLIYTLKVFDIVMVLTGGGPANSTQILSTWAYSLSFTDMSFGQGAAVGNIMIVISLCFSFVYLRFMRSTHE